MTSAPKRRWFRWSLRTMFAVVTVVGVWLGYELNWIHARRQFIAQESAARETVKLRAGREFDTHGGIRATGMLWIFGEPGYSRISVLVQGPSYDNLTPRDKKRFARAKTLFPEAEIRTSHVTSQIPVPFP